MQKYFYIVLLSIIIVNLICMDIKADDRFDCVVKKVHDGDTFSCITGVSIRIWGVNSPEVPPKVTKEEALVSGGLEAQYRLERLIKGKKVQCIPKSVSYSRIVGQCFLDSKDLAIFIIKNGLGVEEEYFSKGYYKNLK